MKTLRTLTALTALTALAMSSNAAHATYILTVNQTGTALTFSGSGSINTGSFTLFSGNASTAALLDAEPDLAFVAITPAGNLDEYNMADSGPAGFGPGGFRSGPTASVVGTFIFEQDSPGLGAIDLPAGYVSGTLLTASASWPGATYASLGITPGDYTWTWGSAGNNTADSFELNIAAVPEPTTMVLLSTAAAIAGFGFLFRRRRATAIAA